MVLKALLKAHVKSSVKINKWLKCSKPRSLLQGNVEEKKDLGFLILSIFINNYSALVKPEYV